MLNTQTETATTDKAPTATEISIQAGISLLKTEQPSDRGEAFNLLKDKATGKVDSQIYTAAVTVMN